APRVVHQRRDHRGLVVDRIVLGQPPHVGLGAPVRVPVKLPVGLPVRVGARVDPVALLETHDTDPGAGKPPGDGSAGGPGSNHEHVGPIVGGHALASYGTAEAAVSSSLTFQSRVATAESYDSSFEQAARRFTKYLPARRSGSSRNGAHARRR